MTKECVFAKSDMTPCVLKDGDICYAMNLSDEPICVGCGRTPLMLGREPPKDWDKQVSEYKAKQRRRK